MAVVRKSDGAGLDSRQGGTARDTTDCQRIWFLHENSGKLVCFQICRKIIWFSIKKIIIDHAKSSKEGVE